MILKAHSVGALGRLIGALNHRRRPPLKTYLSLAALAVFLHWPASIFAGNPAMKAKITGVTISIHRTPLVTFEITDSKGQPLDLSDIDEGSIRFTIAALIAEASGESRYQNYILKRVTGKEYVYKGEVKKPALAETLQPDFDDGGLFTRIKAGVFTYAFKTSLPANYDRSATHVVGGELTREKGKYVANPIFEFVPAKSESGVR